MTDYQKKKRLGLENELGRPDPKAVEKGMQEVLAVSLYGAAVAVVRSDKHRAYPRAISGLNCAVDHRQTDSRLKRDRHNELFEVNSLDMFIRHSCANHKRETIAFSKRRQASAERMAVFLVWKNYVKHRFEKRCRKTPAMLCGLATEVLSYGEILAKRLFPTRIELTERWREYYWRRIETPVLGVNRRHESKYAF